MKHKIGNRYRVDQQGDEWDCRIGTLEMIDGTTGHLMRDGKVRAFPLDQLHSNGVLQQVPERVAQPEHYVRLFEVLEAVSI